MAIPLSGRVPGRASGPSRSLGRRQRWIAMCSGKVIGYLDFSRRGVFIGEGASSGVDRGDLTCRAWPIPGPRRPIVWGPHGPTPSLLRFSGSFGEILATGFGFIQFRGYFLCNFSETQKQQNTGNWHRGDLLIG
jgi:hypothetical protein